MEILYNVFSWMMECCYSICNNYGWAIVLFTFLSKILLLPVSVWVQKNSIKMVKMQPDINFITAKYYGDSDAIAEHKSQIFKREKYNPFASIIPLIIQLLLLMGVIEAVKHGIGSDTINTEFYGIELGLIPKENGGWLIMSPIIAGASAWAMCICQNYSNVLQSEQSAANKYGTMIFSVALSLYLGWFVPVGVALYWIASNIMAIIQLYILNYFINPKKYVDYEKLEKSKHALEELGNVGSRRKKFNNPDIKRERADYKRFFSVINKHLVFYSESSGFYKYYEGIIRYIIEHTNVAIHYITSDPKDQIFDISKSEDRIKTYYIGEKKLITLMMKMDADIVVMTMPDLENYHIKRSYVRDDIEYIYIPHGMDSLNMTMRTGSMDHYDTVFCVGKHQLEEIRKTEEIYGLPKKNLVKWGYCLLDEMRKNYQALGHKSNTRKTILIAPSWQPDNIVDSCLEEILESLCKADFYVTVRPHPQHVKHGSEQINHIRKKYESYSNIQIQTDFSSNSTVFEADLLITDWSGIAYEYAYTTQKPVLFVNTPMKVMNPEYKKIDTIPINVLLRDKIGLSVDVEHVSEIGELSRKLLSEAGEYYDSIGEFVNEYVYNLGNSAQVGAEYIIGRIIKNTKKHKEIK